MRTVLLLCTLLLTACSQKGGWSYQEVISNSGQFDSVHLHFPPENELTGIGVEFLKGSFGTIGYAYVVNRTIPSLPKEEDYAIFVIQIDEETFPYKAQKMEGGQRLSLPKEAVEKLLASLTDEQPVTIYLNGYMSKLSSSNFAKNAEKFQN